MKLDAKAGSARELLLNTGLALFKGIAGWLTGSSALLADAFRSAADACTSYASVVNLKRPAETVAPSTKSAANLILAVVFLVIGLEIGISAIRNISLGINPLHSWYASAAISAIVALGLKVVLSPRANIGVEIATTAAVLIGVGAGWISDASGIRFLSHLDTIAALFIAAVIIRKGSRLAIAASRDERESANPEMAANELMEIIQRVEGVVTVEAIHAKEKGHYIVANIVISVNPRISVMEGNDIAKRVKLLLMKRFIHLADVQIYVEPYNPGYPYKSNHDPNQEEISTLLQ